MDEATFSGSVLMGVGEYCRELGFHCQHLEPAQTKQRTGDPTAYPFDLAMTLPQCALLLLELKIADWKAQRVSFRPQQEEWLLLLWELDVPVHICYPRNVNFEQDPALQGQGRPPAFALNNSNVSPPNRLYFNGRLSPTRHRTLRQHLDDLTAVGGSASGQALFACLHENLADSLQSLTASTLVVLFNQATRTIILARGDDFQLVFAELKRIVESRVSPEKMANIDVRRLRLAIRQEWAAKSAVIAEATTRRDARRNEMDVADGQALPDLKPKRNHGWSR